ncbi:cytochrome P450 [Gordonia sp. NPDC003950]
MHIAMFTDFHPDTLGGISVAVADQARELRRRGHTVTVFAPESERDEPTAAADWLVTLPPVFGLSVNGFPAVFPTRSVAGLIDEQFTRRGPVDLVHVHTTYGVGAAGVRAARRHHLPLVQTMHSRDDAFVELTSPAPLPTALAMRILHRAAISQRGREEPSDAVPGARAARGARGARGARTTRITESRAAHHVWHTMIAQCRAADAVITPSHHFATRLTDHGYAGDVRVIPNGVDDALIDELTGSRPDPADGPLRLLWCGRLSAEKRPLQAIEAVAASPGVTLDLIGDGDQIAAAANRIAELNVADRVRLLGRRDRAAVITAMRGYDALLFTSVGFDTQGLVLTEAAAAGLPVIHSDPDVAESIHAGSGFLGGTTTSTMAGLLAGLADDRHRLREAADRLSRVGSSGIGGASPVRQSELSTDIISLYSDLIDDARARHTRLPATPDEVPAAPGAVPVLGHSVVALRRGLHFIRTLGAVGPVVRLNLGRSPAYLLTTPDLIRQVGFRTAGEFHRDDLARAMHEAIREASNVLHGSRHEKRRRQMAPALRQGRLARYAITTAALVDSWSRRLPAADTVDLTTEAHGLILETVTSTLFSADFGASALERVRDTVPWLLGEVIVRGALPAPVQRLRIVANRRFARRAAMLRSEIGAVVAAYRTEDRDHDDVLSVLVGHTDDPADGLTDDEIVDELLLMVAAGVGSTASILAWVWYEILRAPSVMARVVDEVTRVVGDGPVRADHLPELVYLRRVVQETLRMWGPWISSQNADGPVTFGDDTTGRLTLPADAMVIYSPYLVSHDPRYFADPESFDPDRWAPGRVEHLDKRANLAFGVGERHCPGSNFAMSTILLATAALFARRTPRLADPRPVRPSTTDFVASPSHLRVRLEVRR